MKRKLRDNGLSLAMFGLFLVFFIGMSIAGWKQYNSEQQDHHQHSVSYAQYLGTGHFAEAVFENWESEFLQMAGYVALTVFLFQRGSAESKDPDKSELVDEDPEGHRDDPDVPWPVRQGGVLLKIYNHSLTLALLLLFVFSFVGHALGGLKEYNHEQIEHGQQVISLGQYLASSSFWFQSLQNWQSEFLAIAAMIILSIRLRQKGSPESKPVFRSHHETGNQ